MKIFTGKVVSTKMAKTATVAVGHVVIHPLYKKRERRIRRYQVHDELGAKDGDAVKFVATKPYSKTKKWKILEIVKPQEASKVIKVSKVSKERNKDGTN